MKILILCHRDTSIKYFLEEHVIPIFSEIGHDIVRRDSSRQEPILVLYSDSDVETSSLRKLYPTAVLGLIDPKLNNSKQRENLKLASFAVVSSIEQFDRCLPFNRNLFMNFWFRYPKKVTDFEIVSSKSIHPQNNVPTIVYHGNLVHLSTASKTMIPALANLSRRFQFSFKAIYNVEKLGRWKGAPKSIDVRHVQWTSDSYLNHLASGDIGVLPNFVPTSHATSFQLLSKLRELFFRSPRLNLNRMDYNLRFKHNSNPGRLYDFARAGLPVVAEPSISIGQALQHGVDGFLALTQEGWEFHLEMLLLDGNLRNQMGKNLQRRFQTYSDGRLASQAFIQEVRRFLPGL